MFNFVWKIWKVKYTSFDYTISEFVVLSKRNKALSLREQLSTLLGINQARIVSVMPEVGLRPEIKPEDLTIILISLHSSALLDENLMTSFKEILNGFYNDKNLTNKLKTFQRQELTLAQTFERLHMHPVIVSLTKSAEETGGFADAFLNAIDFVELDEETQKASKTGFSKSLLFLLLGLTLIFVLPVFIADFLNETLATFNAQRTSTTIYFNFIANNINIILTIFLIAIFATIFAIFNKKVYQKAKFLPIFKNFYKLASLKKAIVFLPFYLALNSSGINDKNIVRQYEGIDADLSKKILIGIKNHKSLSDSLHDSGFPNDISKKLSALLKIENVKARKQAFEGVIKLLSQQAVKEGGKISKIFSTVGFAMIVLGILTILLIYETLITVSL